MCAELSTSALFGVSFIFTSIVSTTPQRPLPPQTYLADVSRMAKNAREEPVRIVGLSTAGHTCRPRDICRLRDAGFAHDALALGCLLMMMMVVVFRVPLLTDGASEGCGSAPDEGFGNG